MSKYDFELDLDKENSLSIIIDNINPNSKILEFGPAHGRLTKYLKESMNCIVDIIELDEKAGLEASKYANRYFIGEKFGNIEDYLWLEELKDERYDYIVFADVLEHLYCPENVLKASKKLLKDEGSILLSLPNIAHNSIIIDLINDEFKYNELGLLDNTHIRFFTYKSLIRMLDKVGLVSVKEQYVYEKVGENEIINSYDSIDKSIAKGLKNRDKGNVYQFVFKVKKLNNYLREQSLRYINLDKYNYNEFVLYIKDIESNLYTESKTIRSAINTNNVSKSIDLRGFYVLNEIRIDPIESNCIIDNIEIYTIKYDKRIDLSIKYTNADFKYYNQYFFSTEDPQIYVDLKGMQIDNIFINYDLVDYDDDYINKMINMILKLEKEKEEIVEVVKKELKEKEEIVETIKKELKEKEEIIKENRKVLLQKEEYISAFECSIYWKIFKKIKKIIGR